MSTSSTVVTTSEFEVAEVNGAGTPPDTQSLMGPSAVQEEFVALGGVLAPRQLLATGKGSVQFAFSLADINRMLPKTVKGVFRAKEAWAELYLASGLLPAWHAPGRRGVPQLVARAAFECAADGPAAIDFSGRVALKDGPMLASVWTVVVQALGRFERSDNRKQIFGGRLTVIGTLPVSVAVRMQT